ncbi:MAG: DUF2497 domain-containing protein [Rhizobiaceae bacterium]
MGEAAAKEPTMEDILSSIRKIIAEEGEPEAETMESKPALDSPVEVVPEKQTATLQDIVAKTAPMREAAVVKTDAKEPEAEQKAENPASSGGGSLASIAATLKAKDDEPAIEEPKPSAPVAEKPEQTRVQMAEAAKPPEPSDEPARPPAPAPSQSLASAPAPIDSSEESAFKGALMSPSSNTSVSDSFERLKRSAMDDLDAKTEAILRPLLREWLDENLPNLVERLVREEIERVARGT